MENTEIAVQESKEVVLSKRLNESVTKVLGAQSMEGFEKSFLIAQAIQDITYLLTPDYMKPIMQLQGNKLGFKSDKVYDEKVVKNCLIEAVLTGVQPFGNQFNIIAGNCYITKEGFGYLLSKVPGLTYHIIPQLPRINNQNTGAAVVMKVKWKLNGAEQEQDLDIPVKMNQYMGTDGVIGKATRKARAWLYNTITGNEVGDGEVEEGSAQVLSSKINSNEVAAKKEFERIENYINQCKEIDELDAIETTVPDELKSLFTTKRAELLK